MKYEGALALCASLYEEHQKLFKAERIVRYHKTSAAEEPLHALHKFCTPSNIAKCGSYAQTLSRDIVLMRKQAARVNDENDAETLQQLHSAEHVLNNKEKPKEPFSWRTWWRR